MLLRIAARYPLAVEENQLTRQAADLLVRYFAGEAVTFDLAVDRQGFTPFQLAVYEVVARIPYGRVITYAEVAVEAGVTRIVRVVAAFECGAVVNPDHLKNQIEGSIIMGLGGALFEAVEFENGRILNPRFSRYRVPRVSDAPPIETVLLDRRDLPSTGAGETPIVCIAPAIGNALFQATGRRLRSLPLV